MSRRLAWITAVVALTVAGTAAARGTTSEGAPTGTLLWSNNGLLVVTDVQGAVRARLRVDPEARVNLSPDGARLAVSDARGLRLVELDSGASRQLIRARVVRGILGRPRFSADGKLIAVGFDQPSCFRQLPLAGVLVVEAASGHFERRPVWEAKRPWRKGDYTHFINVLSVRGQGGLTFRESRYAYGECRYQDLVEERYWSVPQGREPRVVVRAAELGETELAPDGTRLAYTLGRGDECQLEVSQANGRRPTHIAERGYVALGCSRGISGMSLSWSPDGRTLYYTDGSALYAWNRITARSEMLLRPPGSPTSRCEQDQACFLHVLDGTSRDGSWLLLEQSNPWNYTRKPKVLLVDVLGRTTRNVRSPGMQFELVSVRLD